MKCSRCRRPVSGSVTKRGSNLELGVIVLVHEAKDGSFALSGVGFCELGERGGVICRTCLREIVDMGEAVKEDMEGSKSASSRARSNSSSAAVAGPLPAQERRS